MTLAQETQALAGQLDGVIFCVFYSSESMMWVGVAFPKTLQIDTGKIGMGVGISEKW